jgi:hypothetical protein
MPLPVRNRQLEYATQIARLDQPPHNPISRRHGKPERQRCKLDRPLLVALDDSCGAMARLID